MLESVQKQAMRVIIPGFLYEDALDLAGLDPLYVRRVDSCKSFVIKAKKVLRFICPKSWSMIVISVQGTELFTQL